ALPSKQYSMMNKGKRLRSIEVEAGGMIKTNDNFYEGEAVRLSPGDELVVRINQDRTVRKAPAEEKAQPLATVVTQTKPSLSSAAVTSEEMPTETAAEKPAEKSAEVPVQQAAVTSTPTPTPNEITNQTPALASQETKPAVDGNATAVSSEAAFALKPAIPEVKPESEGSKVLPESAWIPDSESAKKTADEVNVEPKNDVPIKASSETVSEGAPKTDSAPPKNTDVNAQIKVKLASEGPSSDRFRVVLRTGLNSETARVGDRAQGILKDDFKIGDTVIAKVGSGIVGRVTSVKESCRWTAAVAAKDKRFQRSATLKIVFDTIITTEGKELAVGASIPVQENVFLNSGSFKKIVVSSDNEIIKVEPVENSMSPFAGAQATFLKMAATAGMGPLGLVAMPFIMVGAVGSAEPGLARSFQKTFISKGDDLYLSPGDEILVRARLCNTDGGQKAVSAKVIDNKSTNNGL
ncbi:MAG: hypothetical protein K2X81_15600, partial [Candidatus Obscuribacterales bacterium]|nr:hypothetical protein [Candidatus Obscuribacterales bacterium]